MNAGLVSVSGLESSITVNGVTYTEGGLFTTIESAAASYNTVAADGVVPAAPHYVVNTGKTLAVINGTFDSIAAASSNGGAIENKGGTVSIEDSTFSGGTASSGGAIYNYNNGVLTVTGCTFSSGNAVDYYGAGIYCRGAGSTLTVIGCTFSGNTAKSVGGAICCDGSLTIGDTVFNGNYGSGSSGALYFSGTASIVGRISLLTATDYLKNAGGGAFTVSAAAFAGSENADFYQVIDACNAYLWSGAGITVDNDGGYDYVTAAVGSDLYIKSTSFTTAILSEDASITSVEFLGGTVSGSGYLWSDAELIEAIAPDTILWYGVDSDTRITVAAGKVYQAVDSEYSDSVVSGGNGAAIENKGTLVLDNVILSGNTVSGANGAAIWTNGSMALNNVTFSGNSASGYGGALRVDAGTADLTGVTFTGNTGSLGGGMLNNGTTTLADVTFSGNYGRNGGGAIYNSDDLILAGLISLETSSDAIVNDGGSITISAAGFAAGDDADFYKVIDAYSASLWNSLPITVDNSGGYDYATVTVGSDLYIKSASMSATNAILSGDGSVTSIEFLGGTVTGGGYRWSDAEFVEYYFAPENIYWYGVSSDTRITIAAGKVYQAVDSEFSDSVVSGSNGGAFENKGTLVLDNVILSGNTVTGAAGASIWSNNSLTLNNVTITGNSASGSYGGAIRIEAGSATFTDVTFSGNTASYGGALLNNGTTILDGVTFSGNRAGSSSGAIWNQTEIIVRGDVTLATSSDTIYNYAAASTITIAGDATLTTAANITGQGFLVFDLTTGGENDAVMLSDASKINSGVKRIVKVDADVRSAVLAGNAVSWNGGTYTLRFGTDDYASTVGTATTCRADGLDNFIVSVDSANRLVLGLADTSDQATAVADGSTIVGAAFTVTLADGSEVYAGKVDATRTSTTTLFAATGATAADTVELAVTDGIHDGIIAAGAAAGGTVGGAKIKVTGGSTKMVLGGGDATAAQAQASVEILGGAVGTVYGGGKQGGYAEGIRVALSGTAAVNNLYAGVLHTAGTGNFTVSGAIDLAVGGSATVSGFVFGGGKVSAASGESVTFGNDIDLNIAGGSFASGVYGLGYAKGPAGATVLSMADGKAVNLTIDGGTFSSNIYLGALTDTATAVAAALNATVNGGTISGALVGGGLAQNGGRVTAGDVSITVTGGEIASIIGGGSHVNLNVGNSTSVASVTIDVSGGSIGSIYAGGHYNGTKSGYYGADTVTGDATLTLSGDATVGTAAGSWHGIDTVVGERRLVFDDFVGTCRTVCDWDLVTFDGENASTVNLSSATVFGVGAWSFDVIGREAAASTALVNIGDRFGDSATIDLHITNDATSLTTWNIAEVSGRQGDLTFDVYSETSAVLATGLKLGDAITGGSFAGYGFEIDEGTLKFAQLSA